MVKLALVLAYRYIWNNNLRDKVKFYVQIHDEFITQAHPDFAEEWGKLQVHFMETAAKICLKNDLLTSDCSIGDDWGL